MKKLTIAVALLSLSIAAPVFACPDHDAAPRTAEKAKDAPKETTKASAEKAKGSTDAKPADNAKPAEKAKPADKVSQK